MGKPWAQRGSEALALLQNLHPHFRIGWTEADWTKHAPTKNTVISGSCVCCGLDLQGTLQDILLLKQKPGSAVSGVPHDCTVIETSTKTVLTHLQDTSHVLIGVQMMPEGTPTYEANMDGLVVPQKVERRAVAITRCGKCDRKCYTRVRSLLTGLPACWCTSGSWKGDQGYKRAVRLIRGTPFCAPAFTLLWWNENVTTLHAAIPIRCRRCQGIRKVGLKSLKLGYGACLKCTKTT
jgi:hypothetical protein